MIKKLFNSVVFIILFIFTTYVNADKLLDIQNKNLLTVGITNYIEPFAFKNNKNQLVGFEIELIKNIAKDMNLQTKFIKIDNKNTVNYLLSNKVDILIGSIIHTKEKDKNLDFTISYFYDGQIILARKNISANSYKDFSNKKIAAVIESTNGKVFNIIQPSANIIYFSNLNKAIEALKMKKVDAVTDKFGKISPYLRQNKNKFKLVGNKFTLIPYAIAIKENESNFKDEINFKIQDIVRS